MWRELFNAPWPDESAILPDAVQAQATQRVYDYWRSRGWQLVAGALILWVAAQRYDVPHDAAYGVLAGLVAGAYLLGLLPARLVGLWLMGTVVLFSLLGMLVNGLGAVVALSYMMPYTFAGMLISGRSRLVVQAGCVVAFWGNLIYEVLPPFSQLDPPRYILVSYNILIAAFTFQTLRFLNQVAVAINTVYVAEKIRQQSHQFLARVSHDLRTPLNSMLGFAKLLRRTELSGTQTAYLEQVIDEGEMLNRLVSDLLDSAHLATGKVTLKREACDLNALCAAVADEHRPHMPPPVELRLDLAPDLPPLVCDAMRLRQALGNLVSNAVKHTQQGAITIRTRPRGEVLLVAVQDTGPGIPEEQQQLIFVPFVQLDVHQRGVGLGLDIALQLVRLHGGDITLVSAAGEGCTFTVSLPLDAGESPSKPPA